MAKQTTTVSNKKGSSVRVKRKGVHSKKKSSKLKSSKNYSKRYKGQGR